MNSESLLHLLKQVEAGETSVAHAAERLAQVPFEDAGFAKIDHHRSLRVGMPEVIYAAGKTSEQVAEIFFRMARADGPVLATRATADHWTAVQRVAEQAEYFPIARIIRLAGRERLPAAGRISVVCAGTSDLPVAEEAALTAECMGVEVDRVYDVGVAGLHRVLSQQTTLRDASALIVCAGMEGALPSVVGGLVRVPVIAVPTSVGYGAAFGGVAALLGMLNSCSPNVTVVNIDNGFGAAYVATMIARASAAPGKTDSGPEYDRARQDAGMVSKKDWLEPSNP
jgi:NCAIR mutase (PurE)-related protein